MPCIKLLLDARTRSCELEIKWFRQTHFLVTAYLHCTIYNKSSSPDNLNPKSTFKMPQHPANHNFENYKNSRKIMALQEQKSMKRVQAVCGQLHTGPLASETPILVRVDTKESKKKGGKAPAVPNGLRDCFLSFKYVIRAGLSPLFSSFSAVCNEKLVLCTILDVIIDLECI